MARRSRNSGGGKARGGGGSLPRKHEEPLGIYSPEEKAANAASQQRAREMQRQNSQQADPPSGTHPVKAASLAGIQGPVHDGSTPVHAGYNFVPVSRRVFLPPWARHVSHDFPLAGALSGQFPIRITAHTPVIPGGERGKSGERTTVSPFAVPDGTPAIPGTTLKGMIRAVVEIAGFGRMSPVNDHRFAVRDLTPGGKFYTERMTRKIAGSKNTNPLSRGGFLVFNDTRDKTGKRPESHKEGQWLLIPAKYTRVPATAYDDSIGSEDNLKDLLGEFDASVSAVSKYDTVINCVDAELANPSDLTQPTGTIDWAQKVRVHFYDPGWTYESSSSPVLLGMRLNRNPIRFDVLGGQQNPGPKEKPGVLVLTGGTDKRKREFIFHDWEQSEPVPIDQGVIDRFLAIVSEEEGQGEEKTTSSWGFWLDKLKRKEIGPGTDVPGIPVFWVPKATPGQPDTGAGPDDDPARTAKERGVYALGTSQMFKLPYDFSVREMLDHTSADHRPDPTAPDLAALIFGQVADDAGNGRKSRVSFGTAKRVTTAGETTPSPALPLASPKASYYPCYVRQATQNSAEGRRWGVVRQASNQNTNLGQIYATYMKGGADGDRPRLRGWKRYPARRTPDTPNPPVEATSASATTLNLLPEGTVFEGMVRFHNLLPAELGALVWALTWGGDDAVRHGLGMGKAYGYGQVTVTLAEHGAWVRANPDANPDANTEPPAEITDQEALSTVLATREAFASHMETWAASAAGPHPNTANAWAHSEQIVMLKRMAHPDNTPPKGGHTPMILGVETGQNNHFQLAKGARPGRGNNATQDLSSYALPEPEPPKGETPAKGAILREI